MSSRLTGGQRAEFREYLVKWLGWSDAPDACLSEELFLPQRR